MASFKDRLKQILIRDELIKQDDLDKALDEQKRTGEELTLVLLRLNLIKDDIVVNILSEALEMPAINLQRITVDPKTVAKISKENAVKYKVLPISIMGESLTLAMSDPLNIMTIDSVKAMTGYSIIPVIASAKQIEQAIEKHYAGKEENSASAETFDDIIKDIQDTGDLELLHDVIKETDKAAVEQLDDEGPIIKLTDTIIQQAVAAKASDVFVEPLEKMVRVRYRIDGVIREIDRFAKILHFPIISRIKVISNLDISEHRLPQDGRFKTLISGDKEVDFRVNVLPTAYGEKAVLRVLDQDGTVLDVESLGFDPKSLERLKECAKRPHGLILTCGPTGSGKTTTLYSILKHVDSIEKNIVTVEDPVEYQLPGINQVNVKPSMGLTFATSLRSILRQDPDIILIGEIRDSETLDIAIKAALTGHLVLSSLHTTTAAGSIVRMMNMGVEPFLICTSVLAIIGQRLLRRICKFCSESYVVEPAVATRVGLEKLFGKKKFELKRGKGCKKCFNTGYKGRVGITEILIFSPKIREVVLARAGEIKIKEIARKEGMLTMREDGLTKALEGLTTLEEVLRVTAPDENINE